MRPMNSLIDRRRFLALTAAGALAPLVTPAVARGAAATSRIARSAFGTGWSVLLPSGAKTQPLHQRIEALLVELDLAFSPWRPDSLLSRFNTGEALAMPVSSEVAGVTASSLAIAGASDGYFDPTVGPLVARWGFGPIDHGEASPEGWRRLSVDNDHIVRSGTGLTLDLCGIAKGHALDRVSGLLRDTGCDDFLVDLGGELAAHGRHPSGREWQVGVEDPRPGAQALAGRLRLDGMAVATSGDRTNGYNVGSRRYSHIIDPATLEPVETTLASVSVIMPTASAADGWATALMAAGGSGPDLARRQGIAALFLFRAGSALREVTTGTIEQHLA